MIVLNNVYKRKIRSFEEFSSIYFGKKISKIINILLTFLLFISFVVMLSGSGAALYENFQIPYIYGIIIMAIASLFVFIFGVKGIANANNTVVPFLIFVTLWVGLSVIYKNQGLFSNLYTYALKDSNILKDLGSFKALGLYLMNELGWLWSSFVYFSFNTIGALVVMCSLRPLIHDRKSAKLGGALGGLILGILAMIILLSLLILYTDIIGLEVPMVMVANSIGSVWKTLYILVLLIAMFTTAIANGYGSIQGIRSLTGINEKLMGMILCFVSIPLATLGFKRLVTIFYPLFGYIGMIFICAIILKRDRTYKGF